MIPLRGDIHNLDLQGLDRLVLTNGPDRAHDFGSGRMILIFTDAPIDIRIPFKELPTFDGELVLGAGAEKGLWFGESRPAGVGDYTISGYLPHSIRRLAYLYWAKTGMIAAQTIRFYTDNNEYKEFSLLPDSVNTLDLTCHRMLMTFTGDGDFGATIEYQFRFFHYG
jgi:hypothetical protein